MNRSIEKETKTKINNLKLRYEKKKDRILIIKGRQLRIKRKKNNMKKDGEKKQL
jgi:hypothetical protein